VSATFVNKESPSLWEPLCLCNSVVNAVQEQPLICIRVSKAPHHRRQKNPHIQQRRPIIEIIKIILQPLAKTRPPPVPMHLRPPRQPRTYLQPHRKTRNLL